MQTTAGLKSWKRQAHLDDDEGDGDNDDDDDDKYILR